MSDRYSSSAANRKKRVLILLNATAGTGKAGTNAWDIVSAFASEGYEPVIYPIVPGTGLGSEHLLAQYEGRVDMVFCGGGDGTLNHVIQGIMRMSERPLLAYLPAGSTNDFAKGLGIPPTHKKALEIALHGSPFRFDVMQMNDRFFNYVAAFGAFSAISYATDQQMKNVFGHAAYILNAITEWNKHIHYNCHMRIETDADTEEGDYLFGAVCSTISVGGFEMFKGSDVRLNDGKMELLLIRKPRSATEIPNILNSILTGSLSDPNITFRQVSRAKFFSDRNTAWSLDGEFGGAYDVADVCVHPQAVTIMSAIPNSIPETDLSGCGELPDPI